MKKDRFKKMIQKGEVVREKTDKDVRPFHRLILESGAISYLAVAVNDKDHQRAKNLFDQAILMSKELKNKYHMTMRSKQLKLVKKEFKF